MPSAKFQSDLAFGQKFELVVQRWLLDNTGLQYEQAPNRVFTDWDLNCAGIDHAVECKYDAMSRRYGNFLIEVDTLNKSKAHDLFIGDGFDLYIFPLAELRDHLRHLLKYDRGPECDLGWFGDGKAKQCVKVKREKLLRTGIAVSIYELPCYLEIGYDVEKIIADRKAKYQQNNFHEMLAL